MNIQINLLEHSPILIKKPASNKFKKECDSIDIVFGGGHFDSKQNFIYKKFCNFSPILIDFKIIE